MHSGVHGIRISPLTALILLQAQESALLSEEVRTQLEQVQQRLKLVREEVVENSISREKESFNARRAQVLKSPSFSKHGSLKCRHIIICTGITDFKAILTILLKTALHVDPPQLSCIRLYHKSKLDLKQFNFLS